MTKRPAELDGDAVASSLASNIAIIRKFGVKRIGIFGSKVNGHPSASSDTDILVEFEAGQETFENLMRLYRFLETLIGGRIDMVTRGGLSPYVGPYILKEVRFVEGTS